MVGRPPKPRFVDIARGKDFGRFDHVTRSSIKPGFVDLYYNPSGIGGLSKTIVIRSVPEGGFVEVTPADDPNVCPEGVVYLIQSENGESPVKDIILRDVETINKNLMDRVDVLQAQLEKYKDIEKQASIGFHREVKRHQKVEKMMGKEPSKPLADVRPRRPSMYDRFEPKEDEDEEIEI